MIPRTKGVRDLIKSYTSPPVSSLVLRQFGHGHMFERSAVRAECASILVDLHERTRCRLLPINIDTCSEAQC